MADSTVAVTAGVGTPVQTFANAAGNHEQYTRERRATAETDNTWTVVTTASTSQIAADVTRVGLMMTSFATARVYLRFDSTAPTSANAHWFLDPGDRWEVPSHLCQLAVSMLGATAGGTINSHLATAA